MKDKETDVIKRIECIAELMQLVRDEESIKAETIQRIGETIILECKEIE